MSRPPRRAAQEGRRHLGELRGEFSRDLAAGRHAYLQLAQLSGPLDPVGGGGQPG
jgi:hypothetical protein